MHRPLLGLTVLGLVFVGASRGNAGVILESATFVNSINGGNTLSSFQLLGNRFHVDSTTLVDYVGGNIGGLAGGGIFAAIVSLSSPTALPAALPGNLNALASTTFTPPTTIFSSDFLVPLSITLSPGDYALIFGSGQLGATGVGSMPFGSPVTAQQSSFVGNTSSETWTNFVGLGDIGLRFVVTGSVVGETVPEPSSLIVWSLVIGILGVGGARKRMMAPWLIPQQRVCRERS